MAYYGKEKISHKSEHFNRPVRSREGSFKWQKNCYRNTRFMPHNNVTPRKNNQSQFVNFHRQPSYESNYYCNYDNYNCQGFDFDERRDRYSQLPAYKRNSRRSFPFMGNEKRMHSDNFKNNLNWQEKLNYRRYSKQLLNDGYNDCTKIVEKMKSCFDSTRSVCHQEYKQNECKKKKSPENNKSFTKGEQKCVKKEYKKCSFEQKTKFSEKTNNIHYATNVKQKVAQCEEAKCSDNTAWCLNQQKKGHTKIRTSKLLFEGKNEHAHISKKIDVSHCKTIVFNEKEQFLSEGKKSKNSYNTAKNLNHPGSGLSKVQYYLQKDNEFQEITCNYIDKEDEHKKLHQHISLPPKQFSRCTVPNHNLCSDISEEKNFDFSVKTGENKYSVKAKEHRQLHDVSLSCELLAHSTVPKNMCSSNNEEKNCSLNLDEKSIKKGKGRTLTNRGFQRVQSRLRFLAKHGKTPSSAEIRKMFLLSNSAEKSNVIKMPSNQTTLGKNDENLQLCKRETTAAHVSLQNLSLAREENQEITEQCMMKVPEDGLFVDGQNGEETERKISETKQVDLQSTSTLPMNISHTNTFLHKPCKSVTTVAPCKDNLINVLLQNSSATPIMNDDLSDSVYGCLTDINCVKEIPHAEPNYNNHVSVDTAVVSEQLSDFITSISSSDVNFSDKKVETTTCHPVTVYNKSSNSDCISEFCNVASSPVENLCSDKLLTCSTSSVMKNEVLSEVCNCVNDLIGLVDNDALGKNTVDALLSDHSFSCPPFGCLANVDTSPKCDLHDVKSKTKLAKFTHNTVNSQSFDHAIDAVASNNNANNVTSNEDLVISANNLSNSSSYLITSSAISAKENDHDITVKSEPISPVADDATFCQGIDYINDIAATENIFTPAPEILLHDKQVLDILKRNQGTENLEFLYNLLKVTNENILSCETQLKALKEVKSIVGGLINMRTKDKSHVLSGSSRTPMLESVPVTDNSSSAVLCPDTLFNMANINSLIPEELSTTTALSTSRTVSCGDDTISSLIAEKNVKQEHCESLNESQSLQHVCFIKLFDAPVITVKAFLNFICAASANSVAKLSVVDSKVNSVMLPVRCNQNILDIFIKSVMIKPFLYIVYSDGCIQLFNLKRGCLVKEVYTNVKVQVACESWLGLFVALCDGSVSSIISSRLKRNKIQCDTNMCCMATTTQGTQKLLCMVSFNEINIWDIKTGYLLTVLPCKANKQSCIRILNNWLFLSSNECLQIFDISSSELLKIYKMPGIVGLLQVKNLLCCGLYNGLVQFFAPTDNGVLLLHSKWFVEENGGVTSLAEYNNVVITAHRNGSLETFNFREDMLETCPIAGCQDTFGRMTDASRHVDIEH